MVTRKRRRVGRPARRILCQCPQCERIVEKGKNVPCSAMRCPVCGIPLREAEAA
ncbi:MAG: hypothetical protein QMD46_04510 [Methanomicrobiales archaeon]|nr:hypothetical protein [Methanomicrobiales archaeon]MDI6876574.1 hypothetical protein [Methanomicrobiales archaeon]